MGYTTQFSGSISLTRKLTMAEAKELLTYNDDQETIPTPNPGGCLQWVPTTTLDGIVWDDNEKFYDYEPWLRWLCAWLKERGIGASGLLHWSGEDRGDTGELIVVDNEVAVSPKKPPRKSSMKPLTLDALAHMALELATAKSDA